MTVDYDGRGDAKRRGEGRGGEGREGCGRLRAKNRRGDNDGGGGGPRWEERGERRNWVKGQWK